MMDPIYWPPRVPDPSLTDPAPCLERLKHVVAYLHENWCHRAELDEEGLNLEERESAKGALTMLLRWLVDADNIRDIEQLFVDVLNLHDRGTQKIWFTDDDWGIDYHDVIYDCCDDCRENAEKPRPDDTPPSTGVKSEHRQSLAKLMIDALKAQER